MKKPTFSKIVHWISFLFENFFQKNSFFYTSITKEWRNLKNRFFQNSSFSTMQNRVTVLLFIFFLLSNSATFSQVGTKFKARLAGGSISVKGDIVLIGNSIINRAATLPVFNPVAGPQNNQLFTGTVTNLNTITNEANVAFDSRGTSDNNNNFFIEYSNVDPGTAADGIFSSSSADLAINQTCKKIKFAGLYWSAIYPTERSTSTGVKYNGSLRSEEYNKIKFKLPGATSAYQDITADEIIFTSKIIPAVPATGNNTATFFESPYVCFKDVTSLLAGLKDASGADEANGKYTVANVRATRGKKNGGGAGGWTLVVIYETPTMPSKFISVFDGYYSVDGTTTLDIPVSGYKTLPTLKVNAKIGVAALEGDVGLTGDTFQFRNDVPATGTFTKLFDAVNDVDNFFNATISDNGVILTNRNPASKNSMGFDIDNVVVPNANNAVIPNGASAGTLRLTTSGDGYGAFLATFAVDIIEPKIKLTKKVINTAGNDITNQIVNRGDELRYVIGFENIGSDKAKNVYIEDYLPNIVLFNPPVSAPLFATLNDVLPLPAGVTIYSYNPSVIDPHDGLLKRKIVFKIDESLVDLKNDQERFISFKVHVPVDCKDFSDACSNEVKNIAYSIYAGEQNAGPFGSGSQPPSVACALGDIATNFIGNIDGCLYDSKYTLCGNNVAISGRNGFQNYTWTGPNGFTATGQTINVSKVGDYIVKADPIAPCLKTLTQTITVALYSNTDTDALLKYAANLTPSGPISDRGEIVQCDIDGKKMPHIFLCGAGDHRDMSITNAAVKSVDWYQLTGAACIATAASNSGKCANEDLACSWTLLQTSNNYSANTAGYFKAVVRYDNGCFNTLYFNVYKNDLNPTATATNIICTKPGTMTVAGVPASGYEYSFNVTGYTGTKTFNSGPNANVFSTSTPQNYTATIRQIGVLNGCEFTVSAQIDLVDFKIKADVTQPTCVNVNGSIQVTAPAGGTNYVYTLSKGGTVIQTVGPVSATNNTFLNQSPGTYSVNVKTSEGCDVTVNNIKINALLPLTATVGLTKAVTCTDGEITIYPVGGTAFAGTPPYYLYSVNGAASVANPVIPITLPLAPGGVYNIQVTDQNNCNANTSITVTATPKPVYTVKPTNILCYGSNTGVITFDVTSNTGGYTLAYSIDGGATYSSNPVFSNLVGDTTYSPRLKYTLNGVDCIDTLPNVTLTQPIAALTASAGVSELAGCGPAKEGKIRITNPQGGTPFPAPNYYLYSFDDQITWVTINDAYKAPGTYTVYIKDANGCIYPMPGIVIDPEPVAPIIGSAPVIVYACDGKATGTVTVTNPASATYDYTYSIDGTLNTPPTSNVFTGIKAGDHTIRVNYILKSVTTFSNLLKEDFGRGGNVRSIGIDEESVPKIEDGYCYHDLNLPSLCKDTRTTLEDNQYVVTKAIIPNNPAWYPFRDHTSGGTDTEGRFLAVNIGKAAGAYGVLYSKDIVDVIPNQPIIVDLYVANLLKTGTGGAAPIFRFQLVDPSGNTVGLPLDTGKIAEAINDTNRDKWVPISISLNPGANTKLTFQIRSGSVEYSGNDAVMDDIKVYQLPKACVNFKDIPVKISDNQGFSAQVTGSSNISCAAGSDGTITISAQNFDTTAGFQYSKDGITWLTSTTSPVTLINLGAGTYTPQVRFNTGGACTLTLPSKTINAPTPIVVKTTQTLATCFPNGGATIDATTTVGGTGAYTIKLKDNASPFTVTNFPLNGILTNVAPGSYTLLVTDAKGCTPTTNPTITIAGPASPTATIDPTSTLCFDPTTGAIIKVRVTGGVGPYTYTTTFGGTTSAASPTFSGPTFAYTATVTGTYSFDVYDVNGCKANTISQIINDKLTAVTPVTTPLDCDVAPANQAVITGTISGGKAPFVVTLLSGNASGTLVQPTAVTTANEKIFTYSIAVAGAYSFQIKDANNCITTSDATINPLIPITLGSTNVNPKCNGSSDGTIQLNPGGGSGGFTYSTDGITYNSTSFFTGLSAGTPYTYYVKDTNKCTKSLTVTLTAPSKINGTATVTTPYTCNSPATITVSGVTGGTAPYNYTLNRGATVVSSNTTGIFNNISVVGSYTVTITDSNSCSFTTTPALSIVALNPPTDLAFNPSALTCPTNKSNVTITTTPLAGNTPYTYTILPSLPAGAVATATGINNLSPGTYNFEVTDAKGCKYQESYEIIALPTLSVSGSLVSNVICKGSSDGKLTFTVSGNSGAFTYVLKNSGNVTVPIGQSTLTGNVIDYSGLAADTYTITITNTSTTCTATKSVTVSAPALALAITAPTITPITCSANASIVINTTGGWGGNSYTVTGTAPVVAAITQSTNTFTNLTAGNYTATVKDLNGCTVSIPFTIATVVAVTASIGTSDFCYDSTDKATLVVSPNTQTNYVYSINGGATQANGTFVNLTPGTYTIRVTDTSTACFIDLPATIANQVTANASITKNLDCTASPNAIIKVTVGNGYPDYSYRVSTNGTFTGSKTPMGAGVTTFNHTTTTGAAAATYSFEITDAKGCIAIITQAISAIVPPTATTNPTNPTCFGGSNGSVLINASSGSAPYTYEVSTVSSTGPFAPMASNLYSGAPAGDYWFRITDAKSCPFTTGKITLVAPTAITAVAAITTPYTCNGSAVISVTSISGGTAPYNYTLNRGATVVSSNTTGVFNNISVVGSYTVTITDSSLCTFTTTPALSIVALNPPTDLAFSPSALTCPTNKSNVTITTTPLAGNTPYTYTILPSLPAGAVATATGINNLSPGTYLFEVTDAKGCKYQESYEIIALPTLSVSGSLVSNVICKGSSDGKLTFTVSGNSGAFTYELKNSGNVVVPIGQSTLTGNVIDYTGLPADTYTITITNTSTTCTATKSVTVSAPALALSITAPTITPITCSANASIVINTTGGWGGNSYTVTGTAPVVAPIIQSNTTFTNLAAGDYTAAVKDLNGCTVSIAFTIAPLVGVTASINNGTSDFCYDSTDKAILVVSPNTQTNYVYSINGGTSQANGTFANLTPGTYTIRVTDTSTACFIDLPATIANQVTANASITKNLDCTASPNAIIKVTVGNGYPDYSYRVSTNGTFTGAKTPMGAGVTTFNHTTTTGALAATYSFEITDAKGCITIITQVINAIVPPTATTNPTNPTCFGGSNGSVLINASSGLAPYTYEVSTDGITFAPMASNLYSNAPAGDYWFRVIDAKSCPFPTGKITLSEPSKITASASATTLTCNASNVQQAALITVTASSGTPFGAPDLYRYSYNGAAYVTSNTFSTNSPSTVTIDVKDANGCIINVPSVTIAALNPPSALNISQNRTITCVAPNLNTDVKLDLTGGVAPFTYEITGPLASATSVTGVMAFSHTFVNLAPNTYSFKVTDKNGCTITGTYKVNDVTPITVSGSLVANATCNGATDGKIQFPVAGNMGAFTYTLVNSALVTVTPPVSVVANTILYTGLAADTYTVTVTNPATGCTATASVKVIEPSAVTLTGTNATKVFCTKPISTITVTATGGTSPLAYAVVKHLVVPVAGDYQGTNVFNKDTTVDGLSYDVYVKDKNGCPAPMGTVSVTSDPVPAVTAVGAGCLGTAYTITATPVPAVGLTTPLTYSLNGGSFVATSTFTITTAGDYTITIKDGNGCTAPSNKVTVAPKLTLSGILDKDITCAFAAPFTSNDAQITLTAGGGTAPYAYEYSLNGGSFTSFSGPVFQAPTPIIPLTQDNYIFKITDANTCSLATTGAIKVTAKVDPVIDDTTIAGPVGVTITKNIRCRGDATAAIAIAIDNTKGQAPFVFKVERTSPTYNNYGTQTSGLTAGVYTVTVTDAKGCTDTEDITINEPLATVITKHVVDIDCVANGLSTGSIIIDSVTGGTPNFNYFVTGTNNYNQSELNNGGVASVAFNVVDFGLYQINVVDANGCSTLIQDILVASPPSKLGIVVTPSPPGDCLTKPSADVAVASAFAGVGPFFFSIYQGPASVYPNPPGTWFAEDAPAGSKHHVFTNLTPGVKYNFLVYDDTSKCTYIETATLTTPTNSTLTTTVPVVSNITCKGSANGSVSFAINSTYGSATNVTYEIFNALSLVSTGFVRSGVVPANGTLTVPDPLDTPINNLPFGSLPVGNYYVLITENAGATNAGCSVTTVPFSITESSILLSVSALPTKNSNTCVANAGIITAIAKDGTATIANPYLYQIFPDTGTPGIFDSTDKDPDPSAPLFDPTFSGTFTSAMTANSFNRSKGDYIVYVKDAYGCIKAAFVSLVDDVAPTITPQTPPCFVAGMNINLDLSTFSTYAIGLPTYSIKGTSFQSSPNFTISAPGNYTLAIKDGNGCIASTPYVVRDEIVSGLNVTKQLDCTASPDATIHGNVVGGFGSGAYSYTVKIGSGAFGASVPIVGSTFDYSATTPDTYTFVITDGTCSVTEVIDVDSKVPTVFDTAIVDVKCFGDNTGSISVNVTSGEGPFEYKLTGGPVSYAYQDLNQFNLLTAATTYIVTVRSKGNLCEYTKTVTVGQPLLPLAVDAPTIIKLKCGTGNVAQAATVTLNGTAGTGTGAFEYSFNGSGYSGVNVFTVNDDGTTQNIPYKVRDANNCEITGSVVIDKLDPPVFNLPAFTQTTVTCLAPNSDVAVVSTNGIGTLTYETIAPSPLPLVSNTTGNFTGLAPGDYVFKVTDGNGCTDQVSYKVNDVINIDLQVTSQTDVICDASATGTATFAVTGFGTGVGTYSCTVNGAVFPLVAPNSNTASTISLTGLAANSYIVRVTDDATGCYSEKTVIINNPTAALSSSNTVTPLGCTIKGAVTINAAGGWGSNLYTLTQPDATIVTNTTGIFGGLTQIGAYTTLVTDANGCSFPDSFSLLAPVNPTATIDVTSDYCYDGTNAASLVVNAATTSTFVVTPYEYSIDNGQTWQASNTFNNLTPGSYDVVVKDAFGCKSTVAVNTVIEPELFATAVKTKEIFCVGVINGTIKITATGGYGPYFYKVSTDNGVTFSAIGTAFTNPTDTDFSVPAAAIAVSYVFEITDSKGCVFVTTPPVIMTPPTAVDVVAADIVSTAVDCNIANGTNDNGTITVNLRAVNNNPDYTYALSGAATRPAQPSNVFAGLSPGTYNVTITSARGCTATVNGVIIANPVVVTASATATAFSCAVDPTTTTAVVTGGGGTGTYSFSSDGVNYFTSNSTPVDNKYTFNLVDTGLPQNPTYYVKDSNGCIQTTTLTTVLNPLPKLISATATRSTVAGSQIDCANGRELIQIDVVGGSVPSDFKYEVSIDGLAYTLLSASAGTPFTYSALTAGSNYQFKITDNVTGCSILSNAYDVPLFNKINVIATAAANAKCKFDTNGAIEINVTGYSGTYNYEILKGGASLVPALTGTGDSSITSSLLLPQGLGAGNDYTVKVIETAFPSCTTESNVVVITEPALALSSSNVVAPLGCTINGAVTINAVGGWGSNTYTLTQPDLTVLTNSTGIFGGLTQIGGYTTLVTDANGCSYPDSFSLLAPVNPTVDNVVVSCPVNNLSALVVTASSLSTFTYAPLEYSIDNGVTFQLSNTFNNLTPGSYDVVVKDAFGCKSTVAVNTVIEPELFATAVKTKEIFCVGVINGTIKITATGGYGPYFYKVSTDNGVTFSAIGTAFTNPTDTDFSVPAAAIAVSYVFEITDSKGCVFVTTPPVIMTPPTAVDVVAADIVSTAVDCNIANGTNDNGTITVNLRAVNNNPDYTYALSGAATRPAQPSNVFAGLSPGTYNVTITSARGCTATVNGVIIANPVVVTASATATAFSCAVDPTTTTAVVTGGGGTGTYSFSSDGVNYFTSNSTPVDNKYTFNLVDTGLPQNPTYYVKDSNGCIQTTTLTTVLNPLPKLISATATRSTVAGSQIDCANGRELIQIDVVGGSVPSDFKYEVSIDGLAYTLLSASAGTPFTYSALTAGSNYQFKITDNVTGCSILSNAYDVPLFNKINVIATAAANAKCKFDTNGAIEINVTGYSGTYNYEILKGGASLVPALTGTGDSSITSSLLLPQGLGAGNDYTVKVIETAFPSCTTESNVVVITEPNVLTLSTAITVKNKNCNSTGATVTVPITSITGGTLGYTYAFVPSGSSPTGQYAASNTKTIITSQIAPLYDAIDVWVKDANDCTAMQTIQITTDPMPTVTGTVASQCANPSGYTINVVGTGVGPLKYSLDGNSFQTTTSFNVSSPGNYTVTVKDANLCTATNVLPITILKPLALQGAVSKLRSCSAVNDGEITLTATDGSGLPNYEYSNGAGAYGSSNVFSGLAAGTYTMNVRDKTTLCVKSIKVTIDAPTAITGMTLSKVNVTCQGGNDGSITVALDPSTLTVNNNPAYNYSLTGTTVNGAVTRANQLTRVFDNLEAGTYTITTTSSRGCQDTKTIAVGEAPVIVVPAPVVVQYGCSTATASNSMNLASITVSGVTGGSGNYPIYEFVKGGIVVQSGLSNVYNQTDLSGGTITVNVYDSKGCLGTVVAAPITPFVSIGFAATAIKITKQITCSYGEDIQVNVVKTGTTVPMPTLTYAVKDIVGAVYGGVYIANNTTGLFTGLPVGNYLVTVTNPVTGCSIEQMHYVNNPNTFDLTIDNIVDVSCLNGTNGSAKVTFVDKYTGDGNQAGSFDYTVYDIANPLSPVVVIPMTNSTTFGPTTLNGLRAGTYMISASLTNTPFCTVAKNFTITGPTAALKINETHTAVTCVAGNNDGSISATAVGGWPGGYEFQLESLTGTTIKTWASRSEFTGLVAGDYIVKVRDSKACVDQIQVTLVNPKPIIAAIAVNKTTLSCFGDTDAIITVNQPVTGGSSVYNYTLEATYPDGRVTLDGPQSSNVFTNLGAASYKVIVADTWTCSKVTNTLVINEPNEVTASLVGASIQTCMSPATVTLSAVGGTGPYTYSADANFATVLGSFANSTTFPVAFTTVPVDHMYYVKDSKGCVSYASNSTTVVPLEPFDFKFINDAPYISCFGDNSGEITAVANGGAGNYTYTLLNSSGGAITPTPLQPTPGYFKGLVFGSYLMEVKSGDCTVIRKPITITQPLTPLTYTAIATDVTCNGNGDGKLVLTSSGGTGVIKYALSPDLDKFVEDGTFLNLEVGHYKAIIQDVRGCKFDYEFDINEPNPIDAKVDPLTVKQELCAGEKTGEFVIGITGGVGPYSTVLDDPKGTYILNKVSFTGLSGGNHTVYIKDANSCTFELVVPLDPAVILNPTATVSNECVNDLPANKVTIIIDPSNVPADVKYSLDSTGVEQDSNVFTNLTPGDHFIMVHHKNGCVDATDTFTIDKIDPLAISIDLGGLNEIVATVTGGSGVYRFSVNGEDIGSNNKYIYFRSGDYTVTVTDSNGCSISVTKYFEFIDIKIPPIFTPTGDGTNDTWKPTNTENYPDIKFVVYDRYGREVGVFGAGQSWDGKYNGTELPMGDYWYVLKLRHSQDDREFIGHFTLYR
ncbi:hypothetical protein DOS84_02275 [Flavobacterium aquariorum]|uniref:MAM domain-containing protein n=1 Tax=Flavobacterium aquariorum TaxID=2217670 RepID=A0A2W7TYK3_9FLAO|nr:T9SS type B sorting domain-containing protein [Flavobacterium aquariorum]PZX95411.1 hypothetical protein DOS84_02275 [Flavobacterium aquariorum]